MNLNNQRKETGIMEKDARIYIAGHRGMVGSALHRKLLGEGYRNLITRTSSELDLRNQAAVQAFFATERPDYVLLAAAKVGGILANNTYRAEFIYDNIMLQSNVIDASYRNGVKKLLFLGSSCIYPKLAPQPLKEEYFLSGKLEPTNEPYAIAKIAGISMCNAYRDQYGCNFIAAMPTNLYGPNDNYDPQKSHVMPALLQKVIHARENREPYIEVWGTGTPRREFLHVDDLADACLFLIDHYNERDFVNVGTGTDITIAELAKMIQKIAGYEVEIRFDTTKPDGTPRKIMDVSKLTGMGWKASIPLEDGVAQIYHSLNSNRTKIK